MRRNLAAAQSRPRYHRVVRKARITIVLTLMACGCRSVGPAGPTPQSPPTGLQARSHAGRPAYLLTDLGVGQASFINAEGQISGGSWSVDAIRCGGAVYVPGAGWSLAPVPQGAERVYVKGTDSRGNLALDAHYPEGIRGGFSLAFTAVPLRRIPIATAEDGSQESNVEAVNSAGHVVGPFRDQSRRGSYFYDRSVTVIGEPDQDTRARAINSRDQVVGSFSNDSEGNRNSHAFLWERGVLTDLGTVGGNFTEATGISDSGVVAGRAVAEPGSGATVVFRWNGQMSILGCPPGSSSCGASAINESGDIVGEALVSPGGDRFAFLWREGTFYRLDEATEGASSWHLEDAFSINDAGEIVGIGSLDGVDNRAYLLTPR
jgi:probable HAF family extracellular repeat protein